MMCTKASPTARRHHGLSGHFAERRPFEKGGVDKEGGSVVHVHSISSLAGAGSLYCFGIQGLFGIDLPFSYISYTSA